MIQVREKRERAIRRIERLAHKLRRERKTEAWFADADPLVREVASAVNGPLLEILAAESGHCDKGAARLFREARFESPWSARGLYSAQGHPLLGDLLFTGNGTPMDGKRDMTEAELLNGSL